MKEIELKFQIPAGMRPAVRQALEELAGSNAGAPSPERIDMAAAYMDTPDRDLARRRCALRVRQEGHDRVQTFKGAGADAMTRLEENRPAPPDAPFDLSLHSPAVQAALRAALPDWQPERDPTGQGAGLSPTYETRFRRSQVTLSGAKGRVLLCLDEGAIQSAALTQPLAELEFELLDGEPGALIDAARRWSGLFGLWLDVQSKALKGTRLAREAATGQPVPIDVQTPTVDWLTAGVTPMDDLARRAWLSTLLDLCAGAASDIAQLRPGWAQALHAWDQALAGLAKARGVQPALPCEWLAASRQLQAQVHPLALSLPANGPAPAPDDPRSRSAQALATGRATTAWALDLLAWLHAQGPQTAGPP